MTNRRIMLATALIYAVDGNHLAVASTVRDKNPNFEVLLRSAPHFKITEMEPAAEIHVVGDSPDIVDAYEAIDGVKVIKHAAPKAKAEKPAKEPVAKPDTNGEETHLPTKESQLAFLKLQKVKVPAKATDEDIAALVDQTKAEIAADKKDGE